MKRFVAVIIAALLILCAGCKNKNEVFGVTDGIKMSAKVDWNKEHYACSIMAGGGIFSLTVNKPQVLDGFNLTWDAGVLTVKYKGLSYSPDDRQMKTVGFAEIIRQTLNSSREKAALLERDEYVISGDYENCEWELILDEKGLPKSLSCEDLKLYAAFSDVTVQ